MGAAARKTTRKIIPSHEQVLEEIEKLKALKHTIPERGMMGNNHDGLDAAVEVLTNNLTHDEIYNNYGDDSCDEFDQAVLDAALDAEFWMNGEDEKSLSDKWNE